MSKNRLLQLSKEELIGLIEEYAKLYTTLDGLWFVLVEKNFGHDMATTLDVEVWESLAPVESKRITSARKITKGGIEAILRHSNSGLLFLPRNIRLLKGKTELSFK